MSGMSVFCAEYPVEPYSSKVYNGEMTLMSRWVGFLTQNSQEADASRYAPEIPLSFLIILRVVKKPEDADMNHPFNKSGT